MSSQTQGIQQLLAAEKKAADKIADARKRKVKKMKEAREEANKELEAYRKKKEEDFSKFKEKALGNREEIIAKLDAETNEKLDEMRKKFGAHKDSLVDDIMAKVYDVKPEIHQNIEGLTKKKQNPDAKSSGSLSRIA